MPLVASALLLGAACSKSSPSTPLTIIFVQKFRYHGMPSTLAPGLHTFVFENRESLPITHEMIPVALPSGKTAQDIINDANTNGTKSEDNWLHVGGDYGSVDTGASIVENIYLSPGNYAIACWQTGNLGAGEGAPHAGRGMVFAFTVTG